MNTYYHIYTRVEYPMERGYRMEASRLPDWINITIVKQGDSKQLYVNSKIHVNKCVKVGPSYSLDFSDSEILKDLSAEVYSRFIK